jgi:hypothetical protein
MHAVRMHARHACFLCREVDTVVISPPVLKSQVLHFSLYRVENEDVLECPEATLIVLSRVFYRAKTLS